MKLLAIETATPQGSVALVEEGNVIAEVCEFLDRRLSERLIGLIDRLLQENHRTIREMDAFAFSQGPGSYTGLRIGLAAVQGLILGTGGKAVAVSTLETLALNAKGYPGWVIPWLDARMNQIYGAVYEFNSRGEHGIVQPEVALPPEQFLEFVTQPALFIGEGALRYQSLITERLGERATFASPSLQYPRASHGALLAWEKVKKGDWIDFGTFSLRYLRPSAAEIRAKSASNA
jgi:tRNA threonylcarbamoyladenosine biosynthesis protein TsaB